MDQIEVMNYVGGVYSEHKAYGFDHRIVQMSSFWYS